MHPTQSESKLPDNAYRELKPGETYVPIVPPGVTFPEVTLRSILFGIAMNVLFAMAATYLALKVGQGIETAIPISILSIGLSGLLLRMGRRASTILENVNILAISTTSGIVAGGTVFTMPAVYLLKLNETLHMSHLALFLQIALVPFLGAVLGVIFLIPFRRYFVREMHGKLPFPEATATNEILMTGVSGATGQAVILLYSFAVGFIYNTLIEIHKLFSDVFTTGHAALEIAGNEVRTLASDAFAHWTEKVKAIFFLGTSAELLGLGFIIGLRYASIICAGSFLTWLVIIPLLAPLDVTMLQQINPDIRGDTAEDIYKAIPRNIGIGGIFTAGLLSIFKMSKVIVTALRQALGGFGKGSTDSRRERTDLDISYSTLLIIGALVAAVLAIYFYLVVFRGQAHSANLTAIAVVIAFGLAFLFTTVSAWAIAVISVTPISGMTVTTIIITAVALLSAGLSKDAHGQLAVLLVGGVVASALSMAGTLVTEFKIGYWVGATPRKIQWSALLAAAFAACLVAATIMFLAHTRGFDRSENLSALPAPQANVMASALKSFLGSGQVPWLTYGVGAVIALTLELVKVSGLAFSLGMYLPMELNTPILIGALVERLIARSSKNERLSKARTDRGVLVASGLIAGGGVLGVVHSLLTVLDEEVLPRWNVMEWLQIPKHLIERGVNPESYVRFANWAGLVAFLTLCLWSFIVCMCAKPRQEFRR